MRQISPATRQKKKNQDGTQITYAPRRAERTIVRLRRLLRHLHLTCLLPLARGEACWHIFSRRKVMCQTVLETALSDSKKHYDFAGSEPNDIGGLRHNAVY